MDLSDWIWIIPVVYFVLSAIGGVAQKKAKEMAEQQRQRREQTTLEPLGEAPRPEPDARPAPAARPTPQPQPQRSAEDIAAEIRRMMGLEPARPEPEVVEEVLEPIEPLNVRRDHGGNLHDEIAAREASGRHSAGSLETRHLATGVGQRQIGSASLGSLGGRTRSALPAARVRDYSGSAYVDTSNIARALVTAEVLGPPKALRDDW